MEQPETARAAVAPVSALSDSLAELVGEVIVAMIFFHDHLAVDFGAAGRLTCFEWPSVMFELEVYGPEDAGYRDALCGFVGEAVVVASWSDDGGTVVGSDGAMGAIQILPHGSPGPAGREIAVLTRADQRIVWRSGEPPLSAAD